MSNLSCKMTIEVGGRPSPLSLAQIDEVLTALRVHHPLIQFAFYPLLTVGDRDQKTSLRQLDRTDFFTKEIDAWVLEKEGRIGIHSAKDLADPLKKGLSLYCLTSGLDPADVLVMRPNETIEKLPLGALIATSSQRREESVRQLRADLTFCDLRGTIGQRLAKLEKGEVEGVVVAECALIRLGLNHLNRIRLPGNTAEGQGKLAIVGRSEILATSQDREIKMLFSSLDC